MTNKFTPGQQLDIARVYAQAAILAIGATDDELRNLAIAKELAEAGRIPDANNIIGLVRAKQNGRRP